MVAILRTIGGKGSFASNFKNWHGNNIVSLGNALNNFRFCSKQYNGTRFFITSSKSRQVMLQQWSLHGTNNLGSPQMLTLPSAHMVLRSLTSVGAIAFLRNCSTISTIALRSSYCQATPTYGKTNGWYADDFRASNISSLNSSHINFISFPYNPSVHIFASCPFFHVDLPYLVVAWYVSMTPSTMNQKHRYELSNSFPSLANEKLHWTGIFFGSCWGLIYISLGQLLWLH